jgi:hypothetical protein
VYVQREGGFIPVELSTLQAVSDGPKAVRLEWTTASETNNAGFAVLHQGPMATTFDRIGFVKGAGTTSRPQTYAYRLDALAPGTHQFQLRQTDTDGTTSLTRTVSVSVAPENAFHLSPASPTPTRTQTTLTLTVQDPQPVTVTLYDLMGRRVRRLYTGRAAPERPVQISVETADLAPGMYFVRATGTGGSTVRRVSVAR